MFAQVAPAPMCTPEAKKQKVAEDLRTAVVQWGLAGETLTVHVPSAATIGELRRLVAKEAQTDVDSVDCCIAGGPPLPDADLFAADANYHAFRKVMKVCSNTLYLQKFKPPGARFTLSTMDKLGAFMSCVGWRCTQGYFIEGDREVRKMDEAIPEELRAKAAELQQLIDYVSLTGGDDRYPCYAFVVEPGSNTDLKDALTSALGVSFDKTRNVRMIRRTFRKILTHDDDDECFEEAGTALRMQKATELLEKHGRTYVYTFDGDEIVIAPKLYFAQNEESKFILGILSGYYQEP